MNGLEQVKQALADALESAGTSAVSAFTPGWAKSYSAPVVAVGLRTGESRGGTLGSYLGERVDPETQAREEIYGMRLELTLSLDIYSPPCQGAAGCDSTLENLHKVMLRSLPTGLRPAELRWEETAWDEDTSMFLRRGSLKCSAFFTAKADEDGVLISDFILKGVVSK